MERNMDESRKAFEQWWEVSFNNGNSSYFGWEHYRDGDGYRSDGDGSELNDLWMAWQASRAAIEIELPAKIDREAYDTDFDDGCRWGHNDAISACSGRIRAAGIKVKE